MLNVGCKGRAGCERQRFGFSFLKLAFEFLIVDQIRFVQDILFHSMTEGSLV